MTLRNRKSKIENRKSGGFSLPEVMFAIMILGIGFIMVAAMFPVAAEQAKNSHDDTTAAEVAKSAVGELQQLALAGQVYPTDLTTNPPALVLKTPPGPMVGQSLVSKGRVLSFYDMRLQPANRVAMWPAVAGRLILSTDTRYAWVPLVTRDTVYSNPSGTVQSSPALSAQAIIICVASHVRPQYDRALDIQKLSDGAGGFYPANLEPKFASSAAKTGVGLIAATGAHPDLIVFHIPATSPPTSPYDVWNVAAEGAFVVISDAVDSAAASANGRVYRIGARRADLDGTGATATYGTQAWEFALDYPLGSASNAFADGDAFIVGRGYTDLNNPASGYSGPAQDIAIFPNINLRAN